MQTQLAILKPDYLF